MSTTAVNIASAPFPRCRTEIRVSVGQSTVSAIESMVTFVLQTGATNVQTYMTRAELAYLIHALQLARDELDEQMTPLEIIAELTA